MNKNFLVVIFGIILLVSIYTTQKSNGNTNEKIIPPVNTPKIGFTTYQPQNGHSPYDTYFGKGIYNNNPSNFISVTAPYQVDIVFLLKNTSGKTIRNEYIRRGTKFNLTSIPYGTYNFSYFSGTSWSDEVTLNKNTIRGGFTKNKSFKKSEKIIDNLSFEYGHNTSYSITLTQVSNGNLRTQSSSENEFFN
jgi:hypothetical protein